MSNDSDTIKPLDIGVTNPYKGLWGERENVLLEEAKRYESL